MKFLVYTFLFAVVCISSSYCSESTVATVASVGERVFNEILARTRQGVNQAIERGQQSLHNVIQDKTVLNSFYKSIVDDDKFSKYVTTDPDGSYLIDWNSLASDPEAFGEFVKIIKESSIYVKMTEQFQQSMSTLSNAQLLTNLNRLNDIINKVQNTFRQAISPTLDKIKIKL